MTPDYFSISRNTKEKPTLDLTAVAVSGSAHALFLRVYFLYRWLPFLGAVHLDLFQMHFNLKTDVAILGQTILESLFLLCGMYFPLVNLLFILLLYIPFNS